MTRRPRVLAFSSLLPVPVDRGDRNRLYHLLQLLASVATVRLIAVERAWEPPVHDWTGLEGVELRRVRVTAAVIAGFGAWAAATGRPYLITRYALPRVRRLVRAQVREFAPDVFWGYQAPAFPLLAEAGTARRIIDLVDSPSRYAALVAGHRGVGLASRLAMAVQWRIAAHERRAIAAADAALVNSAADAEYVRTLTGRRDGIVLLDNCVPAELLREPWLPDASRPPTLLFVGNLAYVPNAVAVRLIVGEILPRVRRRVPQTRLVICGARGEALAREWAHVEGVEWRGFVDSLPPLYRAASVMLVPVPLAGGTQYKLLESLAVGLPAVVSRVSADITGVDDGRQVLVGTTADEYADAVCRLLGDPTLAARLSDEGRRFVAARHTWESKRGLIEKLVGPDAGSSTPGPGGSGTQ
jgi:glycosyltransferase involved in cell wall biosynthesis